jgi:glycosyltransferase involved in cell wall biosynthesis
MKSTSTKSYPPKYVAVVVPCFNEESFLRETCSSLGFGDNKKSYENSILILVDNNSTDSTRDIAEKIKLTSLKNTVFITSEIEQGFIPARHDGNCLAKKIAERNNWNLSDVLILQADADTCYSEDYINIMRTSAEEAGQNILLEARTEYPTSFKTEYHKYIDLCNKLDHKFAKLFPTDINDDNIVDDKATGYWLSDYFKWGGHQREYVDNGDEIFAETTRLYLKARCFDASKIFVDQGVVVHSARKILANPVLHLATAGFPREKSWNNQWLKGASVNLSELNKSQNNPITAKALATREEHLIALFCVLPIHVNHALGKKIDTNFSEFSNLILPLLCQKNKADLLIRPGEFLLDSFDIIKKYKENIVAFATNFCAF